MIIECKQCKSTFRLDEGLLRQDGSKVRCSVCKNVFVAYPPGREPADKSEFDQLGNTLTLESPPALEQKDSEPVMEEASDEDFDTAFEEETETRRMPTMAPDQIPEDEEEEEFNLEMEDLKGEKIELQTPPAKKVEIERKPQARAKPAKEPRPKPKKVRRSKWPLVIVTVLLLLAGGAGALILFAPELIPEQMAFLKGAQKPESKDPGVLRLRFTAVSGSFVQNSKAGQLFVIKGSISNNYSQKRSYVLIKGSILDDKGKVVKTKVAYAGNSFTDNEIKDLPMEEINQGLRNRAGKGNMNVNIEPQASVPFMIVFEELPENLSEFTVEPVSSFPGQ